MTLELGIFVDLRNPAGWRRGWADHYARSLALVVEAERLGAGSVWLSEHHGFDDGYLPQPLTFAAAVAARTTSVRIGTAILLAALRHPRHVAEEAAIVDLLSGGRLELGLGAGYGAAEFEAFGVDLAERYRRTDAMVVEVRRLLAAGEVTPPPVQDPLPIWLGYQGPQGARRAGRLGTGLLTLNPASLEPYRQGLAEGGHDPAIERMAGVVDLVVTDDPPRTMARLVPFLAHQQGTYRELSGGGPVTEADLEARLAAKGRLPGLAVLTPADAVTYLHERTFGLPARHVYCWASVAGMDDDLVARHLELLLGEVGPALRKL